MHSILKIIKSLHEFFLSQIPQMSICPIVYSVAHKKIVETKTITEVHVLIAIVEGRTGRHLKIIKIACNFRESEDFGQERFKNLKTIYIYIIRSIIKRMTTFYPAVPNFSNYESMFTTI